MVSRGAHAQKGALLKQQGQVGVFWLYKGDLLMDSVPLSEAEPYGNSIVYPRGHDGVWRDWQMQGHVPEEIEYDDLPRGRVSLVDGRFLLLADACILREDTLIVAIISEFELPTARTELRTDLHYRCKSCMRRSN